MTRTPTEAIALLDSMLSDFNAMPNDLSNAEHKENRRQAYISFGIECADDYVTLRNEIKRLWGAQQSNCNHQFASNTFQTYCIKCGYVCTSTAIT